VREVRFLVSEPALGEKLANRIVEARLPQPLLGERAIELREVRAADVVREVGSGQPQQGIDDSHGANDKPA
jgi:hypothetical protein